MQLLPDHLKISWQAMKSKRITADDFVRLQEQQGLEAYRSIWRQALLLKGGDDLKHSLLVEIADYFCCDDLEEIERRCERGLAKVADEWRSKVSIANPQAIEAFYDQSQAYIYDLTWWHALTFDIASLDESHHQLSVG